jgi:hypothetical protein
LQNWSSNREGNNETLAGRGRGKGMAMTRSLEVRLGRLEVQANVSPGLGVLQDSELDALLAALKEDDLDKRAALLAVIAPVPAIRAGVG